MTNEEIRRAIDKYQKEHPLHFGMMIDVTDISSKDGADIISQTVELIRKKVEEDTELWCICEMAKMYMQGVKPVYPVRLQGEWIDKGGQYADYRCQHSYMCTNCGGHIIEIPELISGHCFCRHCGAKMKDGVKNDS